MYYQEITQITAAAHNKVKLLQAGRDRYLLSSLLAGMYVGFGILLIFTIGGMLAQEYGSAVRVLMGISFGIALSLVIMAGSELFTGNNMIMTIGQLEKQISFRQSIAIQGYSFLGNLAGSILLALLFAYSGFLDGSTGAYMAKIAKVKIELPWHQLFIRGIFCNVLVCLAIWCSFRMKEEAGKLIMIFWCLFAFITSGFEHSVANMTLLGAALLAPAGTGLSLSGVAYNIVWVSAGNFIGGAVIIGFSYWFISRRSI